MSYYASLDMGDDDDDYDDSSSVNELSVNANILSDGIVPDTCVSDMDSSDGDSDKQDSCNEADTVVTIPLSDESVYSGTDTWSSSESGSGSTTTETGHYYNQLNISFNRKMVWSPKDKNKIISMLYDSYYKGGMFYWKMENEYNIVHVVKEIHTTEAGRHFNITLCNNSNIVEKPRYNPYMMQIVTSNTLHCRVCTDPTGYPYISKFSEIVEWL